jgi:hypothetical protein
MRIDNNLTANKTAFRANLLAKINSKELDKLLPEFQKMASEIPNTTNDIILLTEQEIKEGNIMEFTHASFDYFQQGNPKSVLSEGKMIAYSNGVERKFDSDFADELKMRLFALANRIKRLPELYGG